MDDQQKYTDLEGISTSNDRSDLSAMYPDTSHAAQSLNYGIRTAVDPSTQKPIHTIIYIILAIIFVVLLTYASFALYEHIVVLEVANISFEEVSLTVMIGIVFLLLSSISLYRLSKLIQAIDINQTLSTVMYITLVLPLMRVFATWLESISCCLTMAQVSLVAGTVSAILVFSIMSLKVLNDTVRVIIVLGVIVLGLVYSFFIA